MRFFPEHQHYFPYLKRFFLFFQNQTQTTREKKEQTEIICTGWHNLNVFLHDSNIQTLFSSNEFQFACIQDDPNSTHARAHPHFLIIQAHLMCMVVWLNSKQISPFELFNKWDAKQKSAWNVFGAALYNPFVFYQQVSIFCYINVALWTCFLCSVRMRLYFVVYATTWSVSFVVTKRVSSSSFCTNIRKVY